MRVSVSVCACFLCVSVSVQSCCCFVVSTQNVPVCTFRTSPCVPAPRAHVETHARVLPAYTVTFKNDTRCAWVRGRGCRQPRVFHRKTVTFEHVERHLDPMSGSCLIANFLLTKIGSRRVSLAREVNQSYHRIFPISSLRMGREQHVLGSSNHSPHHFDSRSTARKSHCHGYSRRLPALVALPLSELCMDTWLP